MQTITLYKQIHPSQCPTLAKLGYQSLINLRFDNETDEQPNSAELAKSAKLCGLSYHHLPTGGDTLSKKTVLEFAKLIAQLPKPVMVFCGTGTRAKRLYQSAVVSGLI